MLEVVAAPTCARRPRGDDDPARSLACGLSAGLLIRLGDLAAGLRLCRLLGDQKECTQPQLRPRWHQRLLQVKGSSLVMRRQCVGSRDMVELCKAGL